MLRKALFAVALLVLVLPLASTRAEAWVGGPRYRPHYHFHHRPAVGVTVVPAPVVVRPRVVVPLAPVVVTPTPVYVQPVPTVTTYPPTVIPVPVTPAP